MKINYFPDTDSLYIDLSEQPSVESREISDGVVLDYDAQGRWRGAELVTYPPAVNELRRRRDVALALAVPFASWSSGAPLCSCMPAR